MAVLVNGANCSKYYWLEFKASFAEILLTIDT